MGGFIYDEDSNYPYVDSVYELDLNSEEIKLHSTLSQPIKPVEIHEVSGKIVVVGVNKAQKLASLLYDGNSWWGCAALLDFCQVKKIT